VKLPLASVWVGDKWVSLKSVDDSIMVAVECKMSGFDNVFLVDDGRHKNNTTADEFDRIFVDRNF
jgi:hypothetical protein